MAITPDTEETSDDEIAPKKHWLSDYDTDPHGYENDFYQLEDYESEETHGEKENNANDYRVDACNSQEALYTLAICRQKRRGIPSSPDRSRRACDCYVPGTTGGEESEADMKTPKDEALFADRKTTLADIKAAGWEPYYSSGGGWWFDRQNDSGVVDHFFLPTWIRELEIEAEQRGIRNTRDQILYAFGLVATGKHEAIRLRDGFDSVLRANQ